MSNKAIWFLFFALLLLGTAFSIIGSASQYPAWFSFSGLCEGMSVLPIYIYWKKKQTQRKTQATIGK